MQLRIPILTPLLAAAAVTIHLLPPGVAAALQFDRSAVEAGERWRLVTAHLTHFDANHLSWDVGVFFVLGWFCERHARRTTVIALLAAAVAITLAVWGWQPQFTTYRGLSGLACTLFALQATTLLRLEARAARLCGLIALLGLGTKSGFETATATTLFASGTGYAPVPLAHLVGAAVGALLPVWLAPNRARSVANPARLRTFPVSCRNSVPSSTGSPAAPKIFSLASRAGRKPGPASRRPSPSTTSPWITPHAGRSWRG